MTAQEEATAKQAEAEKAEAAKKAAENAEKAKKADSEDAKEMVSKADYDKLQADLANFKRIEDERKAKEKKKQEDLLREQGQFKELLDAATKENEAMKARLAKLDAVIAGELEAEMKSLPEDFDKTLIPVGDPHDQLVWLRKAKPIMVKAETGRRGDGTPAARGGEGLLGMRSIYNHPTSPKH